MRNSNDEVEAYYNLIDIRAKGLVQVPHIWAAIEAVTVALLDRQTLTGKQVRDIIASISQRIQH